MRSDLDWPAAIDCRRRWWIVIPGAERGLWLEHRGSPVWLARRMIVYRQRGAEGAWYCVDESNEWMGLEGESWDIHLIYWFSRSTPLKLSITGEEWA